MIRLARRALRDIAHITDYIGAQSGRAASRRVVDRIAATFHNIEAFPAMARTGRVPNTWELPLRALPYLVIYRAEGDTITILRIVHAAQLWPPEHP